MVDGDLHSVADRFEVEVEVDDSYCELYLLESLLRTPSALPPISYPMALRPWIRSAANARCASAKMLSLVFATCDCVLHPRFCCSLKRCCEEPVAVRAHLIEAFPPCWCDFAWIRYEWHTFVSCGTQGTPLGRSGRYPSRFSSAAFSPDGGKCFSWMLAIGSSPR